MPSTFKPIPVPYTTVIFYATILNLDSVERSLFSGDNCFISVHESGVTRKNGKTRYGDLVFMDLLPLLC